MGYLLTFTLVGGAHKSSQVKSSQVLGDGFRGDRCPHGRRRGDIGHTITAVNIALASSMQLLSAGRGSKRARSKLSRQKPDAFSGRPTCLLGPTANCQLGRSRCSGEPVHLSWSSGDRAPGVVAQRLQFRFGATPNQSSAANRALSLSRLLQQRIGEATRA